MRPLEILLLTLAAIAAVCLVSLRWRRIGRLSLVGAVVALAVHCLMEGPHWQMLPGYVAICVLCAVAWALGGKRPLVQRIAIGTAVVLIVASAGCSYVLPMFRLPKPTGPYPVGTTILYLKDASRVEDAGGAPGSPRELMVQFWYPAEKSSNHLAGYRELRETTPFTSYESVLWTNSRLDAPPAAQGTPFPVIVFNHGWGGRRTYDTFLTEELASQGYFVASIDHTYNARRVAFPDGRVISTNAASDIYDAEQSTVERVRAIWDKELLKQAADERFVLDRLEEMNRTAGGAWFGRLRTVDVGAIGHSFGGAAATEVCALDPRFRAAVNMDGWFFGAVRARGPNQALLYVASFDLHAVPPLNPHMNVDDALGATDSADLLASFRRFGGYALTVKGAEHGDFTDQPLVSPLHRFSLIGTVPAPEIERIVRTYVIAFFDKTLRGKESGVLRESSHPFPEATLEVWPQSAVPPPALDGGKGR